MSRAEKFIQENTKNCSSDIIGWDDNGLTVYQPWITTDDARKAVEIARNEAIEQTADWLTKHAIKYYIDSKCFLGTEELVEDYKLIMATKDE
jgi:hypothetical protein